MFGHHAGSDAAAANVQYQPAVAAPDDLPELMSASSSDEEIPDWQMMDSMDEEDPLDPNAMQEDDILNIMEVTALHRGQAIDLLREHGGDALAVLDAVFA